MAGYTRNDVTDQISNGNTVDALPLDGEFDAIQGAFAAVGGHSHSGGIGEGAPITVVGPAQAVVVSANSVTPKTDNFMDLGAVALRWKNMFLEGVANLKNAIIDVVTIKGGTINDTTIGATTPSTIVGTTITGTSLVGPHTGSVSGVVTGSLVGNASTASALQTPRTVSLTGDVSGSTSFDGSGNVTITAAVGDNSHNHTLSTVTDAGTLAAQNSNAVTITGGSITGITDISIADGGTGASTAVSARSNLGLGSIATQNSNNVSITGGTISGITDLAIADGGTGSSTAAGARTNLGLGTAATTASTDYATAAQGVLATNAAPKASPALTGDPTAPTQATPTNDTRIATTAFVKANITKATTLEAQAGTGTGYMDATLTAAAIAALTTPAPTTFGAVGVYSLMSSVILPVASGATSAGSNLYFADTESTFAGTAAGTWKNMGIGIAAGSPRPATLFLRIA